MRGYTAIGTIVYNQRPDFKLFLGGVSKSLRASKHSIGAVYAREITRDEVHIRLQQGRLGGIKNRHLKTVCNTICVARRVNTEIYVFEAFEICAGVEVQPERMGVPDGGVSPCLSVGAHHGCEPKIVEINETEDSTADKGGLPGGGRARHL